MSDNVQNAARLLLACASRMDQTMENMTERAMDAHAALREFREREIERFRKDMQAVLQEQQQRHDAAMRPKLVRAWQFVGVMGALAVVLVGGAVWLNMHYLGVIKDNKQSADMVRAINRADVTLCDGTLCARVDTKARRWGEKGEYTPIRPR